MCIGHFVCRVRLISYETFSGVACDKKKKKVLKRLQDRVLIRASLLSRNMTNQQNYLRPAMTHISLGICAD